MKALKNIVRNAIRPGYAAEMVRKIARRLSAPGGSSDSEAITAWCRQHAISIDTWAQGLDAATWKEAGDFARRQSQYAEKKLSDLGLDLGGGGAYDLLYFVTRLLRPMVIVESGVAAGFSSRAFLTALRANGQGHLYSSDFPYFRIERPERFVGYLVEPELREGWDVYILGDHKNFPMIAEKVETIDLLHYDSDKSYAGRSYALDSMSARLNGDALILFDDIQDNWHFRDCVYDKSDGWRIFEFEGKWLGMWGGPPSFYAQNRVWRS